MILIKICGLTRFEDAAVAAECGADLLGFIFYEKSPRKADPAVVARIMHAFEGEDFFKHKSGVGVFVSPTPETVKETLTTCGLQAAQLHKLNRDELRAVKKAIYGAGFAAIQPRSLDEALTALDLVDQRHSDSLDRTPAWLPQLLIDAYHPNLHGGTGQQADFEMAREMALRVPRLVLAGGLTPDNVVEAIRAVRPWAVDVASGTEAAPGIKDHGKVRAFIQAVREAEKDLV